MTCAVFFYTGADTRIAVDLLDENGDVFAVPLTATVTAALVNVRNEERISQIKTILSSDTGNDWPAGRIAFALTASETAVIEVGVYGVEVKIVDTETSKALIPYAVEVVKTLL